MSAALGRLLWPSDDPDALALFVSYMHVARAAHWVSVAITLGVAVAWSDGVTVTQRAIWTVLACTNYAVQNLIYDRILAAPDRLLALRQWIGALMLTIGISGLAWGLLPWTATHESRLVTACFINVALGFAVVNIPSATVAVLALLIPQGIAMATAIYWRFDMPAAALAIAMPVAALSLFSARVNRAGVAACRARREAEEMAQALRLQQDRLLESEKQNAVLRERERLMRDIHDGLGGSLVSALASLQGHSGSAGDVEHTLQHCLEDLRIVVDSLEPTDGDLEAALVQLVFRWRERLDRTPTVLRIDAQPTPTLAWLGPSQALSIMRAVQELIGNAVRHGQPDTVTVALYKQGSWVRIDVSDDGVGMTRDGPPAGKGLRFAEHRVATLGGRLKLSARDPRGTCAAIWLPIEWRQDEAA